MAAPKHKGAEPNLDGPIRARWQHSNNGYRTATVTFCCALVLLPILTTIG